MTTKSADIEEQRDCPMSLQRLDSCLLHVSEFDNVEEGLVSVSMSKGKKGNKKTRKKKRKSQETILKEKTNGDLTVNGTENKKETN